MKVLRAAVVLGVSTPLVVLACGSDDGATTPIGAAGDGGGGGEVAGGASAGGSGSGTAAAAGEGANGGAPVGEAGAGGAGAAESGGAGGVEANGGAGGVPPEPEPECGDASIEGGLVCFAAPNPLTLLEGAPTDVAIGEWNGAAGLDVIVANTSGLSYFPNDAQDGAFEADTYISTTGAVLGAGQLDTASNHLDLLLGQANSGSSIINFGDGEGDVGFTENSNFGSEGILYNFFVADLDGSPASADVVVTFNNSISVAPMTGTEGEGFEGQTKGFSASPQDAVLAKLGTAQWVVYSTGTNIERRQVAYATGTVTFSADPITTPAGGTTGQLDVGDFNEDGFDDIAATLADTGAVNVLFADGVNAGSFATVEGTDRFLPLPLGDTEGYKSQRDVKVGDFNGDGHADIVVSLQGLNSVAIFSGDGEGGFGDAKLVSTGVDSGPTRLAVGDLNGDGVDDIVAVGAGSSKVIVLLSDP